MRTASVETVALLGQEYGWTPRQVEEALAHAIRMCYDVRGMLVEVDVNLEAQTIAARRRNGMGDRGSWVDIDNPILPSLGLFMHAMELLQWGDGAPGRVLEGEAGGYRDGGVIYRVQEKLVIIPEPLLAVMDYHQRPAVGTKQVVVLCMSKDPSGMRTATRRGKEFVSAVVDAYYPGCISGIWMGASNSWAVIRMSSEDMSTWLENGGVNVKHLQQVLGLRRITLLPEGDEEDDQANRDKEVRHFVNNAWKDCRIAELTPDRIIIHAPLGHNDPRKLRTFTSMLKKLAPEREQTII